MVLGALSDKMTGKDFVGREEILKDIYKAVDGKEAAVVLKGPGGSGKTTLLKHTAAQLGKKQFSFIVIEGETHPELILKKIFLKAHKKGITDAEKMIDGTGEALREKILWVVEHYLQKEKIMMVFEDFEINLNLDGKFRSERLKEFLAYLKDALKEKDTFLFFTTETDIPGFHSTPMPDFIDEEFKKFLSHRDALERLNQKSREKLRFDMGSNPRTLKLLDAVAAREFGEKKFDWDTLKKKIPDLAQRILYKENEDQDFSPLLLEKLFNLLTPAQQQLLKGLSVFNHAVGKAALDALQLKITNAARKELAGLSVLDYSAKNDLYRIHRLTARFMAGKMTEEEKKQFHSRAAVYFEGLTAGTGEGDTGNEIEIRRHYLEAEEWDRVAEISLRLDEYLSSRGFLQLAFDLLQEIENRDYTRDNQLRIYLRLTMFYMIFGQFDRVISQNEKLAAVYEEMENRKGVAICLGQMGMAYENKRKYDEALTKYDKARGIFEALKENAAAGSNLLAMGKIRQKRGKYDEAAADYKKALALAETVNDPAVISESLFQLGRVDEERGDLDKALDYYRQSQQLKEKIGNEKEIASGLHQIGNVFFMKGEFDEAMGHYQRSLTLSEKIDDLKGAGYSLGQLGMIAHRKGETDDALKLYERSVELFEKVGDKRGLSSGYHQLGRLYQERGKSDEALDFYKKSLDIREENADMPGMALGYGQLGMLQFEREEYEESLRSSTKSFVLF
ncbi:MAG: tetratricopeptide repeat protein, partial [bacterium]|nr:tetratricopeptide repeat protein [bacterium]